MEFLINGRILGLSESTDGTKLLGKILICPLDEPNLNKKGIKEADLKESELKSLIGQPLVGKVVKDEQNNYDFTGHNLKKFYEYNPETNSLVVKYTFDTVPIGHFTSSDIEELEIDGVTKRCIVANVEIWKRYERICSVILKRFSSDKPLAVSWEIDYQNKYEENGITWLKDLVFIGVAVLGATVTGAYPNARFMEVSELEKDNKELATSLTEDVIQELTTASLSNDESINNNINITDQGGKNMPKVNNDVASMTENDLYSKVKNAINSTSNEWYYIARIYPYEYRAIAYSWDRESEDSYIEFIYTVNSDQTISITSQKNVEMTFVAKSTIETQLAEKDTQISELSTKVSEKDTEISTKLDEIIKLGEEIKSKDTVISEKETVIAELTPFKTQIEASELAKKEAEIAQKKEDLKVYATKGGFISDEEIETSEEIKTAIAELNINFIKGIIADRVVASLDKSSEVETSTVNTKEVTTNLDATASEDKNPLAAFKKFLSE